MANLTAVRTNRIASIDILRGAVMLIMALDHVRDFTHLPAMTADPLQIPTASPAIFFTRWITHFCAPIFVFLSGLSAYLSGQRKTPRELSAFLIRRGLWLILVELAVITLALTFNPLYHVFIFQVIWAIGCSMIILGLLLRVSYKLVLITGLLLVFGHNLFDYISVQAGSSPGAVQQSSGPVPFWQQDSVVLLTEIFFTAKGTLYAYGNGRFLFILYAVLPWTGIMLLGYCFGKWFRWKSLAGQRVRRLLVAGAVCLALFILLRLVNGYGDPGPWSAHPRLIDTLLDFVRMEKYPPSLDYTLMTLGTGLLLLALFERTTGGLSRFLSVYGKVPFFYYVLHFFLVHLVAVGLFFVQGYGLHEAVDPATPFLFRKQTMGVPLLQVYIIWIGVCGVLYFPCKWFAKYKATHGQWWLSYL